MLRRGQVGITLVVIISCSTLAMASAACHDCKPGLHNQTSSASAPPSSWSASSAASASSGSMEQSIKWEVQLNTTDHGVNFQGIGMCKGTTDETRRAGFIAGHFNSIWGTRDGVNWKRVAKFPGSAYWYGVYCFPDAKRVIAVGFANGDPVLQTGAIITWSFDGGETWTERLPMPQAGNFTWLQSVHFYNDTHGIILPFIQDATYLTYYTTNGGRTAADWIAVQPEDRVTWYQSHPIWVFGDVTKTLASSSTPKLCSSTDAGMTWPACSLMNQRISVGSFVSLNDGVGASLSGGGTVYSTQNGGTEWKAIGSYPSKVDLTHDMLWVPDSDIVVLVGGNSWSGITGTVAHSMDRGVTWTESIPDLPATMFRSVDSVKISETTTEVWAAGWNSVSAMILHATVTIGKVVN